MIVLKDKDKPSVPPDVMLDANSLDALAGYLNQIADELRQGKWPKAGCYIRKEGHFEVRLDGDWENV